jgi:hypothetical protein
MPEDAAGLLHLCVKNQPWYVSSAIRWRAAEYELARDAAAVVRLPARSEEMSSYDLSGSIDQLRVQPFEHPSVCRTRILAAIDLHSPARERQCRRFGMRH